MRDLFRRWRREITRFEELLRTATVRAEVHASVGPRFHQSHRELRPTELFAQKRLALYPVEEGLIDDAESAFGGDLPTVALLSFLHLALHHDRPHELLVAEFVMLALPPREFPELASGFLGELLAESPGTLGDLTPAGVPLINLLAASTFGEPTDELLDQVVRWFESYVASRSGVRSPIGTTIGTLLWRALDAGRIERGAMYDLVHAEPDLLRTLESDSLVAGTRVTAAIPPGSRSEDLVEQICLERLSSISDSRSVPTAAIKSISLWPGTDVLLAALDRLESIRHLSPGEFPDTAASSLWHVLRHTRRVPDVRVDRALLDRFSERTLVQAAMVAPWYASDIELAVALPGLTDLVAWTHAHSGSAMGGSDPGQEQPRVTRQIAALVEDRSLVGEAERDDGVFDRDWLLAAVDRLGEDGIARVLQTTHLAFRHKTHLAEAVEAILGHNADGVWTGARQGKQLFVRMLGLLPKTTSSDIAERLNWLAGFATDAGSRNAQKRLNERRAATAGATNLAWTDGVADPMLLAWHHDHPGVMGDGLEIPLDLERHRVVLNTDAFGDPTLAVVKRGGRGRPLKGVPRAVAVHPSFRGLRTRIRDLDGFVAAFRATCERRLLMGYELRPATMRLLLQHPVMGRMIGACVFTDGDTDGFPVLDGKSVRLEDEGELQAVRRNASLVMAHPMDLQEDGTLDAWRDLLVKRGWTQPVPQLFREIPQPRHRGPARQTNDYSDRGVHIVPAVELLRASGWNVGAGQQPRRYYPDCELIACWPFSGRASSDLLNHPVANTGPLHFLDAETRELVPLADVPGHVISDASRDCIRVIASCGVPGSPTPLPVVVIRYAFMQRLVAREEADDTRLRHEPGVVTTVTREQLQLRIRVPQTGGGKPSTRATRNKAGSGLDVAARIDMMTGELRIGDNGERLDPALFEEAAPVGAFPHPPDATLDRLVRTWMGVRAGVASGNPELCSAIAG